jgi:hypothetical protein
MAVSATEGYWLSRANYKAVWAQAYGMPYGTLEQRKQVDWYWKHPAKRKEWERLYLEHLELLLQVFKEHQGMRHGVLK